MKPRLRKKDRKKLRQIREQAERMRREHPKPLLPEAESAGEEMLEHLDMAQEESRNLAAGPTLSEALR